VTLQTSYDFSPCQSVISRSASRAPGMQLVLANRRRARGISTGTTAVHFYRCIRRIRRTCSSLIACDRLDSGLFAGFATLVHVHVINLHVCDFMVRKLVSGCNPTVDIEEGNGTATVGLHSKKRSVKCSTDPVRYLKCNGRSVTITDTVRQKVTELVRIYMF
jgi:hypothetical protein